MGRGWVARVGEIGELIILVIYLMVVDLSKPNLSGT